VRHAVVVEEEADVELGPLEGCVAERGDARVAEGVEF
jgi:hypothetical protein